MWGGVVGGVVGGGVRCVGGGWGEVGGGVECGKTRKEKVKEQEYKTKKESGEGVVEE